MKKTVLPGGRIGMLGGGQLAMMFIESASKLGYKVHVYTPNPDDPACKTAHKVTIGAFDDTEKLIGFAKSVEVATLEFENIPVQVLEIVGTYTQMYPSPEVMKISQNRIEEKSFFQSQGYSVTPFMAVRSYEDLEHGIKELGCPAVLKTATMGYDGKGQMVIHSPEQLYSGIDMLQAGGEWILEKFIDFEAECSVVAARGHDGSIAHLGIFQNFHERGILDVTVAAGEEMDEVEKQAIGTITGFLNDLQMIGIVCIEFFITKDKRLLVNEMAPRPHNSGHISIETHKSSQFDLHVRAVCGLPLGDVTQVTPGAMANVMGDLWNNGSEPDWGQIKQFPDVKLYLYGKPEARIGRKMGHLSVTGDDPVECLETIRDARDSLI